MPTRRGFLGLLAGAALGDPERLLWRPGQKLISIPKPRLPVSGIAIARAEGLSLGDVFTIAGIYKPNGRELLNFRIVEQGHVDEQGDFVIPLELLTAGHPLLEPASRGLNLRVS